MHADTLFYFAPGNSTQNKAPLLHLGIGHPWKLQFIFNSPLEIPHAISLIPTPEIPYLQIPLSLFHNFSFFYFIPTGNSRQNRAPLLHPWKFHKFLLDPVEIPRPKSKTLEIQYFFFLEHPLKFHSALRVKLTPRNSICSFFDTYP